MGLPGRHRTETASLGNGPDGLKGGGGAWEPGWGGGSIFLLFYLGAREEGLGVNVLLGRWWAGGLVG